MRFEIIALLSWLVREGYITSFHVTKDKIYVTIKKQPPLVVAGRLLSKIEVQANRLEVSPLLWFYYSTAFRESQQFFRKKFEARKRAFLFGTLIQSESRKPGLQCRGAFGDKRKKTGGFCLFFPIFLPFLILFSCFKSCHPHQSNIIRTKSS